MAPIYMSNSTADITIWYNQQLLQHTNTIKTTWRPYTESPFEVAQSDTFSKEKISFEELMKRGENNV